ncbi:MAG: hypothetical protein HOP13_03030 [Alphaproteobacteria bacterium]|nr:hypothetical protein [Alphaproteobacteria bacterium]
MRIFGATVALLVGACAANADDLRDTMVRVEALMKGQGVDVAGYATRTPPALEFVNASHPYLQGNDGGYAGGIVYVSNDRIEACTDLILIHELVHDATIKHRLFAAVPLRDLKAAIEALADAVTNAAAENPYRPGCLPHRHFAWESQELAQLAMAR